MITHLSLISDLKDKEEEKSVWTFTPWDWIKGSFLAEKKQSEVEICKSENREREENKAFCTFQSWREEKKVVSEVNQKF